MPAIEPAFLLDGRSLGLGAVLKSCTGVSRARGLVLYLLVANDCSAGCHEAICENKRVSL